MTGFDQSDRDRLSRLDAKIGESRGERQETGPDEATAKGSRVGYELLGAVLAGVGFGYLADTQIGSTPVGTVIGLFLGFAAGVVNAWRATNGVERAVGLRRSETEAGADSETKGKE